MYNGEYFDPRQLIGEVNVNSTLRQRRLRYTTSAHYDTMGIRVTGSPAFGDFGFIAEIVTLPQSSSARPNFGINQSNDEQHVMLFIVGPARTSQLCVCCEYYCNV